MKIYCEIILFKSIWLMMRCDEIQKNKRENPPDTGLNLFTDEIVAGNDCVKKYV